MLHAAALKIAKTYGQQHIPGREIALAALGLGSHRGGTQQQRLTALGRSYAGTKYNTIRGYLPAVRGDLRSALSALTTADLDFPEGERVEPDLGDDPILEMSAHIRWSFTGARPAWP